MMYSNVTVVLCCVLFLYVLPRIWGGLLSPPGDTNIKHEVHWSLKKPFHTPRRE